MSIRRPQRCIRGLSHFETSCQCLHYLHPKALFQQRRNLQQHSRNGGGHEKVVDNAESSTDATKSNKRLAKPAHWKPISKDGSRDLAELAEAMGEMAADVKRQAQATAMKSKQEEIEPPAQEQIGSWYQNSEVQTEALNIPTSPLEHRIAQRKWIPKRKPSSEEKHRMARNPWAAMLVSSMRQDASTKTRFPSALLTGFETVASPEGEDVYVLPADLADLEAFNKRLKTGNRTAAIRSGSNNSTETLRILPYRLLFEEMTDSFIAWRSDKGGGTVKTNSVAKRLFPVRWQEKNAKVAAFSNASKNYWKIREENGELDDGAFKPPEPVRNFSNTKWKASITERLADVMRQRVLLSFNHLAKLQNVPNDHPQREEIHCMPWPQDGALDLNQSHLYTSSPTPTFWNDMGDIESPGALNGEADRQGNISETRPPIAITPAEIEEHPSKRNMKPIRDPSHWLPGSFVIHLGEPSNVMPASADLEGSSNANAAYSKFIPPLLPVASPHNCRLPVFNLSSLLGHKFERTLTHVLRANHAQFSSIPPDLSERNHVILVKAGSAASHFLAQELWQLWRYVGGRDCTRPQTQDETPVEGAEGQSPQFRALKARTSYRGLSEEAWVQLGELLGLRKKAVDAQSPMEGEAEVKKEDE